MRKTLNRFHCISVNSLKWIWWFLLGSVHLSYWCEKKKAANIYISRWTKKTHFDRIMKDLTSDARDFTNNFYCKTASLKLIDRKTFQPKPVHASVECLCICLRMYLISIRSFVKCLVINRCHFAYTCKSVSTEYIFIKMAPINDSNTCVEKAMVTTWASGTRNS